MKKILILGAGFGGLETATGLSSVLKENYQITLIDQKDAFFVGFSKIDVLFGHRTEQQVKYRYENLRAEGVSFVQARVQSIDTEAKSVITTQGSFDYDYLVVALGAALDMQAIPGFVESGGHEFYSMEGAVRLRPVLEEFKSGTLLMAIFKLPYKCPPAPYEVAYQIHDLFVRKGIRDAIRMKIVIPTPRPVDNPQVSEALENLLAERQIELIPGTAISSIDASAKQAIAAGTTLDYDLLIGVPVHTPPEVIKLSNLGQQGYVPASPKNLETSVPNVYAIGDVSSIPVGDKSVPKAGTFAEDAARTVVSDILRKEGLVDALVKFKAEGACYFELGGGQVAKVSSNYLGGEKPQVLYEGPSQAFLSDKLEFESSRRERWFKSE
ncbi:MAG: NAD(P)/FAD-dependent oxidoreductase [Candidatus Sericytochromatia bacterium]